MLETTFILELVLGKKLNAVIIGFLLIFNAVLSFFNEQRAQKAVNLLRKKLQVLTRVLRDNEWGTIPARELVPGDYIRLRMGDFAPADLEIAEGNVDIDQSALTGESLPVERGAKDTVYSGSIVRRGEVSGVVTATGSKSYFGKTTELVKLAKVPSQAEKLILSITEYLIVMDGILVVAIFAYSGITGISFEKILPFALILLIASVPIALPPTFTLSNAIGSLSLANEGVLTTRPSAVQDSAAMETLCSDKTGTLTMNELTLTTIKPFNNFSENDILKMASAASEEASMDAIDRSILAKARELNIGIPQKSKFIPFDPETKRSEAFFEENEKSYRAIKGSPLIIKEFDPDIDWGKESEEFSKRGERTLAVLAGEINAAPKFYGLLGLSDPPRPDSKDVISKLKDLNVRVRMLTGDNAATASHIAEELGINGNICDYSSLKKDGKIELYNLHNDTSDCNIFAGIYPEDKYNLVKSLEKGGAEVIGMTGDGVNDAPALKQAQVGIAVSSATDVAKAAASFVLTNPGLSGMVSAVTTGRRVYQRLFSYISNKIVKTLQIALFLALGLLIFDKFVVTPLMVILLIFTNDFVTMSLSTDNARYSKRPNKWNVRELMKISFAFATGWLIYIFAAYLSGRFLFNLPFRSLQSFVFLGLVYSGQANIYLVRERSYFWKSKPSNFLLTAQIGGIIIATLLSIYGWLIASVPIIMIIYLLIFTLLFLFILDITKVRILNKK